MYKKSSTAFVHFYHEKEKNNKNDAAADENAENMVCQFYLYYSSLSHDGSRHHMYSTSNEVDTVNNGYLLLGHGTAHWSMGWIKQRL